MGKIAAHPAYDIFPSINAFLSIRFFPISSFEVVIAFCLLSFLNIAFFYLSNERFEV